MWRAKVLGGMIGSLFLRSYERSERIYAAMLSRGFDGSVRTMRAERLRAIDLVVAIDPKALVASGSMYTALKSSPI